MSSVTERATIARDVTWEDGMRHGPCIRCGLSAHAYSGEWPVHDDTGSQNCHGESCPCGPCEHTRRASWPAGPGRVLRLRFCRCGCRDVHPSNGCPS